MSGTISWITPTGSLGTIPENISFNKNLEAIGDTNITYSIISGNLPSGLFFNDDGEIFGTPNFVSKNVTSTFVIRATDLMDNVADQTFNLTVQGQDAPEFITPAGQIGKFHDGSRVDLQINYTDTDPGETLTVRLVSGSLPEGVSITSTGKISGIIEPFTPPTEQTGYDVTAFDKFDFDFNSESLSRNYEFTLEITDGNQSNIRTFTIFVESINNINLLPERPPILTTVEKDLGTVRADNYFSFKFDAVDYNNDPIEFSLNGTIPNGLTFDQSTGWLYGYIPNQGAVENNFSFDITVKKKNSEFYKIVVSDEPSATVKKGDYISQDGIVVSGESPSGLIESIIDSTTFLIRKISTIDFIENQSLNIRRVEGGPILASVLVSDFSEYFVVPLTYNGEEWIETEPNTFTLRVIGEIEKFVTWLSPTQLGTVKSGETSELATIAESSYSEPLFYRLNQGSTPPGTTLLSTGEIAGIFNGVGSTIDPDSSLIKDYSFTVEVFTQDGFVSTLKDFTISVDYTDATPQRSIYIKALPPRNDRDLIDTLLSNRDIIPPDSVYRRNDPNFGIADSVIYQHAFGLKPKTLDEYVSALEKNHFNKSITLGPIKTARALNDDGTVRYEVIYSEIEDPALNSELQSVPQDITWPNELTLRDGTTTQTLSPNSLVNMRSQLFDTIGIQDFVLPDWMTSKQEDGRPLGFVPAWVIAYVNPGEGEKLAYRVREFIGRELNKVDFQVERYVLEGTNTQYWNAELQQWNELNSIDDVSYIDDDRLDKYLLFPDQTILG